MPQAGEIHIELATNYADDPKVAALARFGRDTRGARDLYVQMICYAKIGKTDGFVPDESIGKLVYPDTAAIGARQVAMLHQVGLIETTENGWHILAYLKRNKSRAAIEAISQSMAETGSEAGTYGNHLRWHVVGGRHNPTCPHCSTQSPPDRVHPIAPDSGEPIGSDRTQSVSVSESVKNPSTDVEDPPVRGPSKRLVDAAFKAFWEVYPRKVGKLDAERRFAVLARRHDLAEIVAGAKAFATERRGEDANFTPHPATWLNAGRWQDEAAPPSVPARSSSLAAQSPAWMNARADD